jgi:hypothetical protein
VSKTFTDEQIKKLQEIVDSIPDYFDNVEDIQCPYCGADQSIESEADVYIEDWWTHHCYDCGKDFKICGSMSWSWSTEKEAS